MPAETGCVLLPLEGRPDSGMKAYKQEVPEMDATHRYVAPGGCCCAAFNRRLLKPVLRARTEIEWRSAR